MIYSHGNSTDIEKTREYMIEMSLELNVNMIAYEYTGYGDSKKKVNDYEVCKDIQAVYNFLIE